MSDAVNVERQGAVALVRLVRPERMNALDFPMRKVLAAVFEQLADESEIRAIVVTGGPQVFAAGADLRMLAPLTPDGVRKLGLDELWRPIAECPKPLIAAVAGPAFGAGCELALMCDMIVADPSAQFGQPECRVGVMPGAGGTQRLIRVLGKSMASMLLMTGDALDAQRAWQLGLVCELAGEGEAEATALKLAEKITRQPPLAVAAIKRTLSAGADLPLTHAMALENREFMLLFDSEDQKEGMAAFLEKRRAEFKGK